MYIYFFEINIRFKSTNQWNVLQEGEARRKRSADEEEAKAAPAAPVLTYGLPYAAGLPYAGLGYAGLGYAGLGYTSYALPSVKVY